MFYLYLKGFNFAEKVLGPCAELAHFYIAGSAVYATTMLPWLSRSFRDGQLGIDMAIKIGDKVQEGLSYSYFSLPLYMSNKPEQAREYAQKSIDLLKKVGEYWELGIAYIFRDHHNCLIGKLKHNIHDNEEFINMASEIKVVQALGWALLTKGRVFSLAGEVDDQIIQDLKKSVDLLEKTQDHFMAGFALAVLGFACSRRGDHDQAIEHIEKAKDYYFRYHTGCFLLDMFPMGAEGYLMKVLDTPDLNSKEKKNYLKKSKWFCRQSMYWGKRFPYILGWAYQVNGTYYWLINKKEKGIKLWEKGIGFLREFTEDKYRLGQILKEEASFLLQTHSDDKKAYQCLLEARELFTQTEAIVDLEKLNRLLDKISPEEKKPESSQALTQKRYLESLLSITENICSIFDLEELLNKIMDYALRSTGAERGILFLYQEEDNSLKPKVLRGIKNNLGEAGFAYDRYRVSLEIIQLIEKTKQILMVTSGDSHLFSLSEPLGSTDQSQVYKDKILLELISYGIKQVMCIPLEVKGKPLGLLYLDNSLTNGTFGPEELNLGKSLAIQASVSIENAYLLKNLVEEDRFLQEMIEQAADLVILHDIEGKIVNVNQKAYQTLGYSRHELLNMKMADIEMNYSQEQLDSILKSLENSPITFSGFYTRQDKSTLPVEARLSLIEYRHHKLILCLARDITERQLAEEEKKRLEAKWQQAQKMQSIGTLAGGIAHDFNNLLTVILGNTQLMSLGLDPKHPHYELLKEIENQVKAGANLTRQLLGFARGGKYEVKPINLNEVIEVSSGTFARLKKDITIHRKLQEDLPPVEADRGQIEQVLMNLFVNASDAMPMGGDLYLETRSLSYNQSKCLSLPLPPDDYVILSVEDTGIGMDQITQERIFEPFFTTKEMGRGTGLGLASVYGIIKSHHGHIEVKSKPGEGTTFTVYLPMSKQVISQDLPTDDQIIKGTETVLLVDDEEPVLKFGVRILETLGYRVFEAKTGLEAIKIYKNNQGQIDLVILDMIMPDMNGGKIYEVIKAINPKVKVLLASGYSIDNQAARILEQKDNAFIQKPYDLKEISITISNILKKG